jgi:transposase-like protein
MDVRARLGWVKLYEQTGDAGLVCRRCGISRPTLRKWWRRYRAEGEAGLISRSTRPRRSPRQKIFAKEETLILDLRRTRRLGIKRLRNVLIREHRLRLALDTIHKVLCRHGENHLQLPKLRRKGRKRYNRPVPGDRDARTKLPLRPHILNKKCNCNARLFPRKTAANTVTFLAQLRAAMPFPIQRIQTDRGQEFFAYKVQDQLRDWRIKFRPVRPRSPHLNGKVERVQRTALEEFWAAADLDDPEIASRFIDWQGFYNADRPHTSLGGRTPAERLEQLRDKIPEPHAIDAAYDRKREWDRQQHYVWDIGAPRPR